MSKDPIKIQEVFETMDEIISVVGHHDKHLKIFEDYYNVEISLRGDQLYVYGDEAKASEVREVLVALVDLHRKGKDVTERDVLYAIKMNEQNRLGELESLFDERYKIIKTTQGKTIFAKTFNQKDYYRKILDNDLVFGIGPAGTGKTYLAVVIGVSLLKKNIVRKIILTRPVVEAGENLGFLPGDLKEKVDPYLRPLYDALYDVLGLEQTEKMIERGIIEIAPLAYMRGRTLEDAYIILDEAQNTTKQQMKMFLTRLGFNSKMVVTGDETQIDLPKPVKSGLKHAKEILHDVKGIEFVQFETVDVVRHTLVQKIIESYEKTGE
ncbi:MULTISPECIES: PhoH family protein [Turicibacter]|jgi:phoH-like protein|uniref:PhoH-like protein n=3 Tax=Turicibacter sanguinis TaxID=154288 RepID=A0A173T6L3_9FIRM|nr:MULTISPECIES: PhoH family protein [Turicibacter]EFF63097.1 PhoH family protein [Turicibacter sanguinis PC909]EGC91704.1 PhoH-like protein [Turicibacter sp. HGF1]MBP3904176.1 PhoH family protein [Turicibacter sp.]MCU7190993.1 PhoH family protein [Turicibacter sanguinis]MCU7197098.1 PhoH family protein [Turicibacter sanguinis]